MSNLALYDKLRAVPAEAKKTITGGRLNGKTDINPMWRIKALTEAFGPCGIGWWYEITDKHMERTDLGEVSAFVDIALYYTIDGQVSKPVYGTGGSAFIAKEKAGLYVSDECYKMALTDAISVACKALGVGADVYWDKDTTKYSARQQEAAQPTQSTAPPVTRASLIADCKKAANLTDEQFDAIAVRLRGKQYVDKDIHSKVQSTAMTRQELEIALAAIATEAKRLMGDA